MARLRQEIAKVVVGQHGVVSGLLAALLVGGHVLLEGVPGVAKTLLVKTLATAMDLQFGRVQFTPDLMPADLTGQMVLDSAGGLRFRPGPVFTNLLLADEINRTPPKTQAALLEAMEEHQVSSDGQSRPLPDPFLVVATQNPIEYEGTYPLPEAQLDRFLFKLPVGYPTLEEELELLARHHRGLDPRDLPSVGVQPVMNAATLARARAQVAAVTVEPVVLQYVVALARATRDAPSSQLGASPRATVALLAAAKAWAWMSGRSYLSPEEVKATFKPVLRHRVTVRPEVALDGLDVESLLDRVLASVPSPR
ncbi:MAG: AAA family ATPase [Acidimicrobiales bacterium]